MKKATTSYLDEPIPTTKLSDEEWAQAWYALAAESDSNHEQAQLCGLYNRNNGIDWFLSAAIGGDIYAMYTMGKMYSKGVGISENPTKAATWFSKASAAGISYAHYELAKICNDGIGLDPDPEYAENLFKRALNSLENQEKLKPNIHAEYIISTIYEHGLGVDKNSNLANYWRHMADESTENNSYIDCTESDSMESALSDIVPVEPISRNPDDLPDSNLPSEPASPVAEPETHKVIKFEKPKGHGKKRAARQPVKKSQPDTPCLDYLDMVVPSVLDFKHPNYFICGNTFRCVWAIREYPTETEQLAILRDLGEKNGITLHVYIRPVSGPEENKIIREAERRNRHKRNTARGVQDVVSADVNMQDVITLVTNQFKNKETLMHCAVFFELIANSLADLQKLQNEVISICTRSKLVYDKLWLRQQDGFLTVMPTGSNRFGSEFERVIPSSSVGNLYPFSYSGKTDPKGMYVGEDVNGTNIIIDFDARNESKTNGHVLILGNSGEGKSYLLKIIITNFKQQGKKLYVIDVENEYLNLTNSLGGCVLDMMGGKYFINVLEPRIWTDNPVIDRSDEDFNSDFIPLAFRQTTRLSQHIAYLRDFFRSYKDFSTEQLDTLEILLENLYKQFNITDRTDFSKLHPEDYPILSDLFKLAQEEVEKYEENGDQLYTKDVLRSLTLGLRSICVGAESKFFDGYTNITNDDFIDFSVMGMMDNTNENLKSAMFLNIFSWMSHKFLTEGDTALIIDELHMFVMNRIAVNYMRSFMKRGRKRNSDVITASQNVEDMLLPGILEYTKPLFSIPTHSFLFNPGPNCDGKAFQQALNVPDSEWELIKNPHQGHCLFRSGNERYHLHVIAPEYKSDLFGTAGGK